MKPKSSPEVRQYVLRRSLAGVVGIAVGCAGLTAVIVLFGDAASMSWLPATPPNIAAMQRCDGVAGTAARRACVEAVIVQVRARDAERRYARNEPEAAPPWPAN